MIRLALNRQQDNGFVHRYVWTSSDIEAVFDRELYNDLIRSDALQRLADIRFLGAIDYFVHPNGRQLNRRRHNRLEHTLGVAYLALRYSRMFSLSERDEKLLVAAALLHDVGHSPLSHSLEAPFTSLFGIDHHEASAAIILGNAPNGFGLSVAKHLRAASVDPHDVVEMCAGKSSDPLSFLFGHPINIDTIEAISRSETYIKSSRTSAQPDDLLQALTEPARWARQLDSFWDLKDKIYQLLIQGPVGLLADYIAKSHVERNRDQFVREDYYKSERELRKSAPELFRQLEMARNYIKHSGSVAPQGSVSVSYTARRFYIDDNIRPGNPARYRQSKSNRSIKLNELLDLSVIARAEADKFDFE